MFTRVTGPIKLYLLLVVILSTLACSALQPRDAGGPRANVRPYPVVVADDEARTTGLLAWKNLATVRGVVTSVEPRFNSLTGTLEALPSGSNADVILPSVGGPTQTEEQIRESLRRFINDWQEVIGAEPSQLSLIERTDEPNGLKLARYEQRPFRIPLRGNFGNLVIRFRTDRRVVELSGNCIPNTDRLQGLLSALSPKISAEDAPSHVIGRPITIRNASGASQTFTIPSNSAVEVLQLVVYALPSADTESLELHLAWEIGTSNGAIKTIYLDAITDEVLAAS